MIHWAHCITENTTRIEINGWRWSPMTFAKSTRPECVLRGIEIENGKWGRLLWVCVSIAFNRPVASVRDIFPHQNYSGEIRRNGTWTYFLWKHLCPLHTTVQWRPSAKTRARYNRIKGFWLNGRETAFCVFIAKKMRTNNGAKMRVRDDAETQ